MPPGKECLGTGVLAITLALGGCGIPHLAYRPNAPVTQKPIVPLRVTVRPFTDGTSDKPSDIKRFFIPGLFLKTRQRINMARPMGKTDEANIPVELWGKALSEDLQVSGIFQSVQYGPASNPAEQDLIIDGTLKKTRMEFNSILLVIFPVYIWGHQEYAFEVKARRSSDGEVLWSGKTERMIHGTSDSGKLTATVQSMMYEIGQSLVKGLEARRADWPAGTPSRASAANPPGAGESVEDILKKIGSQ